MAHAKRFGRALVAAIGVLVSIALHHPVTTHTAHTTFDYVVFTGWSEVVRAVGSPVQPAH